MKTLFSSVHFTARSVSVILLPEMVLIYIGYGHLTKEALLQSGNDEHWTSKAILEEGDHCDH